MVCGTKDRPNGQVRTGRHDPGKRDGDAGRDITVGNSFTKRRVRSGFGCDHFLENEAAKSCRSIQSGQRKGGNGQSDKLLGEIEVQTNRSHEGGSTLREGVDRAAVFKQFGQLVSRNISDGNNRADGEQTFNQHRTVADELALRSLSSCLELVPELTREWKPEIAPHATVTKRTGKSHCPPPKSNPTKGEISISG